MCMLLGRRCNRSCTTRGPQIVEFGGYEAEVGGRGDPEEGREWDVAEEQVEDAEVGEIEG